MYLNCAVKINAKSIRTQKMLSPTVCVNFHCKTSDRCTEVILEQVCDRQVAVAV